ncbi:hypothetical protein K490DRAFT_67690 [Saccharata proteae CBS 121410]|uniref:F-box domain-containing protein n=1 Tax=Saccharata proteae CBS 121410 TaxID=1314787 RepID=A0A9P4HUJ2_9PEZI|nr:hypothetical protein K490DRAFT_67690 [Saccharata proteae CBS 121410]
MSSVCPAACPPGRQDSLSPPPHGQASKPGPPNAASNLVTSMKLPLQTQALRPKKSRFLSLPLEVRLQIYDYLLFRDRDIYFEPGTAKAPAGNIIASYHRSPGQFDLGKTWLDIMLVSKSVHNETADVLYGANRFHFVMTSVWVDSPVKQNQFPVNTFSFMEKTVVPRLRKCSIEILADTATAVPYHRVQSWLQDAVNTFGDANQLRELEITLLSGHFESTSILPLSWPGTNSWQLKFVLRPTDAAQHYQFVLEPLHCLHVETISISGHVSGWFREQLEGRIRQKTKRNLPANEYGERVDTKRRRGSVRTKTEVTTSLRKFHEPKLNWMALRS